MNTFILGIGTGRCGTQSLATLLNEQRDASVTHERFRANVPWGRDGDRWLERLLREAPSGDGLYGDVALYWLPQAERLLSEAHADSYDVRIVGLKRDKEETIDSYLRKTPDRNHWQLHDGIEYDHCRLGWDKCYPKFVAESKREALSMYWSYYYGEIARLEDKYPERIRCFPTDALNTERGQRAILNFVGCPPQEDHLMPGIRKNVDPTAEPLSRRLSRKTKQVYHRVAGVLA